MIPMVDADITEEHDVIGEYDLDPEMVCRIVEKCNDPGNDSHEVAEEVAELLDIDKMDATNIVRDWREPDWPIEYKRTLRVNSVDVFNDFEYDHRGYNPVGFADRIGPVYATWRIDKTKDTFSMSEYSVELVEVDGVQMDA